MPRDNDNAELASKYDEWLLRDYKDSAEYLNALQKKARQLMEAEQYADAKAANEELVANLPDGPQKAGAMFSVASCALLEEDFRAALKGFKGVVSALDTADKKNNAFYGEGESVAKVQTLLEQAQLQMANCISQLREPAAALPKFRALAIKTFDEFKTKFPKSNLMPKALMGQAGVYLAADDIEKATELFEELSAKYPDSPEGKNSLVSLANSAIEVGKVEVARDAVQKIMADPDRYGVDSMAVIGQKMLDNKLYDEAISLYEKVRAGSQDPKIQEFALYGLGESYVESGDCAKGAGGSGVLAGLAGRAKQ